MVKATLRLPGGTKVELDGEADEVKKLLDAYSGEEPSAGRKTRRRTTRRAPKANRTGSRKSAA